MSEIDRVLDALAHPCRRLLLDRLRREDGRTLTELWAGFAMTRQALSRHLAVLEDARLVRTEWRGREKLHHLEAGPIRDTCGQLLETFGRLPARARPSLAS
jgi:DNA-binding transcriptional ArsR family regulator